MKDFADDFSKLSNDDELSIDDILAEFRTEKEDTDRSADLSAVPDGLFSSKAVEEAGLELLSGQKTEMKEPAASDTEIKTASENPAPAATDKREFTLNRSLMEERVNTFLSEPEQSPVAELASRETLTKNKLDAFFETFYGEESTVENGRRPEALFPESASLTKPEEKPETEEAILLQTEEKQPSEFDKEEPSDDTYEEKEEDAPPVYEEQPLPDRFFNKEEYRFPIEAPPSTDTKLHEPKSEQDEDDEQEEADEFYETTDSFTGKKSLFAKVMSRILVEAEDNEEPADTQHKPLIEIDEFESPEDKDSVIADLCLQKKEAFFKTAVSGGVMLLLLYLNFGSLNESILPAFLQPSSNLFGFSVASILLLLIMAATGLGTFLSGLKGLLTFKANNDTLPAFAIICSILFCGYSTLSGIPAGAVFCFFGGAAGLSFFLNMLGKYLHITVVGSNISFLVNDKDKASLIRMTKSELPAEIDTENNDIAGLVKGNFFTGFFEKSFGDDPSFRFSLKTGAVIILLCLIFAVFGFFKSGIFFAFTVLSGMSALGASFLSGLCFSLPNIRWLSSLKKRGAMIAGYQSAVMSADTNALCIQDIELFPPKTTVITGMKMFGKSEIYDAAYAMASLYGTCGGPLQYAFLKLIDYKKSLLKPVTDICFYEGRGISGILDGHEILAGNYSLMQDKNILMPEEDYEQKLKSRGKQVVFFAEDGDLKGLFTVEFNPTADHMKELSLFDYESNALLVYSDDHNITPELIRGKFGIHNMEVLVYGCKTGEKMKPALERKERLPAGIISATGLSGMIYAIMTARKLKKSVRLCLAMRAVSVILAFLLGGFLVYNGAVMEPLQVLGYQSIWAVLALILTLFGL